MEHPVSVSCPQCGNVMSGSVSSALTWRLCPNCGARELQFATELSANVGFPAAVGSSLADWQRRHGIPVESGFVAAPPPQTVAAPPSATPQGQVKKRAGNTPSRTTAYATPVQNAAAMPVKQRRAVVPVTKKKPTAAIVLVVGSVACIFLAVVVFALSAYSFSKQTSGVNQQVASSPSGNVPPAPKEEEAPTDPVYFEIAKDGNVTRLHSSGRIYIRYSGSSAFQEVEPTAWAYGFYAYTILFQKAYVHGKDSEFERVLANVDSLAEGKLGAGVPDAGVYADSPIYQRLETAVRSKLTERANEEFGLPLEQSTYSDWREKLNSRWIGFAEDIRTAMTSFGSSYLHRLSSVYIHERLFELDGGFDKTVEVYQGVYTFWGHPLRQRLIAVLEDEARDFNRRLYGLDGGRASKPVVAKEPRTPSRNTPREPNPDPAPVPVPARPSEPEPDSEVTDGPTKPAVDDSTPETAPASPKQGQLTLVEMRERLREISAIEANSSLTNTERSEKLRPYGHSWCVVLMKVTSIETVPLRLDLDEAAIYRQDTKEALQVNLGRMWYTPDEEELMPVHTLPPLCLIAPLALSSKVAAKLNDLNTVDRKVKRYFYPRTLAARLDVGDFVTIWMELECATGSAIVRYDVLEAPQATDVAVPADDDEPERNGNGKVQDRKMVPAQVESDEISIDDLSRKLAELEEIQQSPDLSVRERERRLKALGKGWCYVALYVDSTRPIQAMVDERLAEATGLRTWTEIEAIQVNADTKWYDARKGVYRDRWFYSRLSITAYKGVNSKTVAELNEPSEDDRWNRSYYISYDLAAEMKRGDSVVLKYRFDCTQGEWLEEVTMTDLAPRTELQKAR